MTGQRWRKPLLQSVALSTLLVAVAFATFISEPDHLNLATGALLIPGAGLLVLTMWITKATGMIHGPIFPTWLLLSTWLLHYALLIVGFYRLQTWRVARKHGADELHA